MIGIVDYKIKNYCITKDEVKRRFLSTDILDIKLFKRTIYYGRYLFLA